MPTVSTGYLILTLVVAPLIGGGVIYGIQAWIRVREAKATVGIHADAAASQTPVQVLTQQLASKDAQLAQARAEVHEFVKGQMERNDAGTRAILALAEQVRIQTGNLTTLQSDLADHRSDSSARAGKTYEAIGKVNERLAGLEANVRSCLNTAEDAAKTAKDAAELAEKVVSEARSS